MKKYAYIFLFCLYSCIGSDDRIEKIICVLKSNDKHLEAPHPGEWLYEHHEKGQTFEDYKSCTPLKPSKNKNVIYLQPIGKFDSIQIQLINYTGEYLQIFFNLKVKILSVVSNDIVPNYARRLRDGNDQLLAPYILNEILKKKIPADAISLMAITEHDLYPEPSWNYVFGLASYKNKVGVTSLYRLCNNNLDSTNYSLGLNRLIKISSHEIGHMFSLHHCINAICTMNGTNSLMETDSKPNRLCSECTGKIIWNLKINQYNRLLKLKEYFLKHRMYYDLNIISEDIKLVEKKNYQLTLF